MPDNLFQIIYLIGFVAGSVIRGIYTRGHRKWKVASTHEPLLDMVLVSLTGIGLIGPLFYLFSPWLDFADFTLPALIAQIAGFSGAVIFAFALWLLWRSHVDLGKNWSAVLQIRDEHTLVTGGVYSRIRHPMYAAHWLWAIAQILLLHNWIAGPMLFVTFLPMYLYRAGKEEQMVLQQFGDEYRQYMKRTGRIFPRLGSA